MSVSETEYEAFRWAARAEGRPIAQLIREAMALYRAERLPDSAPLLDLPVLPGHRPIGALPARSEIYAEASTIGRPDDRNAK